MAPCPPQRALQQLLLVDDHVEGDTHPGVLEGFVVVVQIDEIEVEREPRDGLEGRVGLDLFHPIGRDVVDHVELAGAQPGEADCRLGDFAGDDALEIGGAVPVVIEAGEFDSVAGLVGDELERPGADRRGALHRARVLGHDDASAVLGDAAEEWGVDLVHLDDDGHVIGSFDGRDVVEDFEVDRAGGRVLDALERVFHVGGGQGGAVVEFDAGAELEGVGQAILGQLEAFGEVGDDVDGDDGAMDRLQHAAGRRRAGLVHVEVLHRFGMAPDQLAARDRSLLGIGDVGEDGEHRGAAHQHGGGEKECLRCMIESLC